MIGCGINATAIEEKPDESGFSLGAGIYAAQNMVLLGPTFHQKTSFHFPKRNRFQSFSQFGKTIFKFRLVRIRGCPQER